MYRSYFKIGWRNLLRHKGYSIINISGLAMGMAVAILIGMWIHDEFSFNTYHQNYEKIVQIMKGGVFGGRTYVGQRHLPYPLIEELQANYGDNFKHIVPCAYRDNFLSTGEKTISRVGAFMGEGAPEMLTLEMIQGTRGGLKDPHSILLAASTATALFGDADPMNSIIQMNDKIDVKVTGIYEDLPNSTSFKDVKFLTSWTLYEANNSWMKTQGWENHFLFIYGEISPGKSIEQVNENIHNAEINAIRDIPSLAGELKYDPFVFVNPMPNWHLFSTFKEGVRDNTPIQSVRIIAMIGGFVLLLACINFMNLSTARSEKRAKEVGIRKSVGSLRSQLVNQFFSESLLVVFLAFLMGLIIVTLSLPLFNDLTGKQMVLPLGDYHFWMVSLLFVIVTGLIAGSYPALYLSSFNAVRVLKGTFRAGRFASMPRKVLVVIQFTVSVTLIIGTIIIYKQVTYAKDRPVGYIREGLLMVQRKSEDFFSQASALRNELKNTGVVVEIGESGGPVTEVWSGNGGFDWQGKDPAFEADFATLSVSLTFGKTVGWQFLEGRDFSEEFASDSSGFVLNEAAVKYMKLENPVGQIVHWKNSAYGLDKDFKVLGVIKDMVMKSPFEPVEPTIYFIPGYHGWFTIKINPDVSISEALPKIESVFKKLIPAAPFDYKFVDQEYALKFSEQERMNKLTSVLGVLAIFISCLGLFGLASFVAEQKTKEIGIRKVVGATVVSLWRLLSKDFVILTIISCLIASPIAYYALHSWLQNFSYRVEISGWIFIAVSGGAILITLVTVSYQAIRAAMANPVKSLRSE